MRVGQPAFGDGDPVCDFCNRDGVRWSYDAFDFQIPVPGMPLDYGSMGNWAACDACADLIDSEAWAALIERAVDSYVEMMDPAEVAMFKPLFVASVDQIQRGFRDHRTPGSVRRAVL